MHCWIALGGNLGDVPKTFTAAISQLQDASVVRVLKLSRTYTTAPIGAVAGSGFLNAAVELETACEPLELLDRLQQIETRLGRERLVRWGPRTLDLDLLLYGDGVMQTPRLSVPHPALWRRRFVLDPLVEIAPDVRHPVLNETIARLRERLLPRPLMISLASDATSLAGFQEQVVAPFGDRVTLAPHGGATLNFVVRTNAAEQEAAVASAGRRFVFQASDEGYQDCRDALSAALDRPAPLD